MVGKRRGRHPKDDLDAKKVAALIRKKAAGRHFDGGGLHLWVRPSGAASWVLRVRAKGLQREIGLGGADVVSLSEARVLARQFRKVAHAGGDPLAERRKAKDTPTFEEAARVVHAGHAKSWRNAKHGAQWINTLRDHTFPAIGNRRVDLIEVADVLKVLAPIWLAKPETARRVRQRIRSVLDWARAAGHREGENPVGPMLAKALPRHSKSTAGHHAALPYAEVPGFVGRLRDGEGGGEIARLAFEFLILTATRTGEAIGARKSEFDLEAAVWTVPADRMKAGREFRVPLHARAVEIVNRAAELSGDSDFVFQGRPGKPLSNMVFLMALRRMGVNVTAHGFRSSFRDWAAETTGFANEVVEMALAHVVRDRAERAYRRGDLLDRRRELAASWAGYVGGSLGKVVPMRRGA